MNEDYYQYLTKRLEGGTSSNPIVQEILKTIKRYALLKDFPILVLDLGCFSGTIGYCAYQKLPKNLYSKVKFIGFDNIEEPLKKGIRLYPEITFVKGELSEPLPFLSQFKIVFLSNVLHEIFTDCGENAVLRVIREAQRVLLSKGNLILLDGIKPSFPDHKLQVEFKTNKDKMIFREFQKKYKAFAIKGRYLLGRKLETDWLSLTAFMTKARYLKESFWEKESKECYQFFTEKDFSKALQGMENIVFKHQYFSKEKLPFKFINRNYPITKNTLITSTKK